MATWQSKQGMALSVGDKFIEESSPETIAKAMEDQPGEDHGEEISLAIKRVGLRMGLLAYGVQFLQDCGAPAEIVETYERDFQEVLAKTAAKEMGLSDWKPLLLKASRTAEQQKIMENLAGWAATNRLRKYIESNYMASIEILIEGMAAALETDPRSLQEREEWGDDISEAISFLNRYYYVLHGEIDPAEKAALSGDQQEELSGMAAELVAYRAKHGGGYFDSVAPCFHLESVAAARPSAYRQTEISQSEELLNPTSLLWEKQPEIATLGPQGGFYDVSKRGSHEPVWVKATITGPEGNPIKIDGIRKGAQRAIGNLIDQARRDRLTELQMTDNGTYYLSPPICITAEQVYRRWMGLNTNATVTPQQAKEMEAAIDSLTSAPSEIDFQAQLAAYKHMKKQSDYDYNSPNAGKGNRENLITASKGWIYTRTGEKKIGYVIFTYPLFYFYSHIINQMTPVKPSTLTGGEEKPAYRDKSIHAAAKNSREASMRNAVAPRLARMKSDKQLTRKIRISEVAADIGVELTAKIERTLLKNLEQYLGELQRKGEISGYYPVMGGRGNRKLMGYSVEF